MMGRMFPNTTVCSPGLSRDLVGVIRQMILAGAIAPGERLVLRDLQERFNVSVIPLREALRTLEAEGWVETLPRRGTRVSPVSLAELRDVYALRRLIEPPLSRQAAAKQSRAASDRVTRAFEELEKAADSDAPTWLDAHREFHWSLLDVDLGAVSARTIRQLWSVSDRYVLLTAAAFRTDQPSRDHRSLHDAFIAGDGERLAAEWSLHLHVVEEEIVRNAQESLA
jgi:DNA-binding GntR family transcriptional regulator